MLAGWLGRVSALVVVDRASCMHALFCGGEQVDGFPSSADTVQALLGLSVPVVFRQGLFDIIPANRALCIVAVVTYRHTCSLHHSQAGLHEV